MPNVNPIKGMHNLRTMGTVPQSAIPEKQDSDFIKFYMLEKERTRLRNEQSRIILRLEAINNRLKDIQEFYDEKSILLQNYDMAESCQTTRDDEKTDFKTMSIDY